METLLTYFFGAAVIIGVTLTLRSKIREARVNSRGWRTSIDTWGIRYEEKMQDGAWNSLLIRCMFRGHGFCEAQVPTDETWNSRHPVWARDRREEIIDRVRSEARALPFVEEPIQTPQTTTRSSAPSRV